MRQTEPTTVAELLEELAYDNPAPEERWFERSAFDPMHRLSDLRHAARKGMIELDESGEEPRFRLTSAARQELAANRADAGQEREAGHGMA